VLESLADGAMKATLGVGLNPRRPTRDQVLALYREALG
jgi:alcohol dehydrogenase class IV